MRPRGERSTRPATAWHYSQLPLLAAVHTLARKCSRGTNEISLVLGASEVATSSRSGLRRGGRVSSRTRASVLQAAWRDDAIMCCEHRQRGLSPVADSRASADGCSADDESTGAVSLPCDDCAVQRTCKRARRSRARGPCFRPTVRLTRHSARPAGARSARRRAVRSRTTLLFLARCASRRDVRTRHGPFTASFSRGCGALTTSMTSSRGSRILCVCWSVRPSC
jgi:hypothetical protein